MHENLETRKWAVRGDEDALGQCLQSWAAQLTRGTVILLHGEMGAGKTTLTRAIARGIGVHKPQRVCSPTYQVAMEHPGILPLVHIDLFRLGEADLAGPAFDALGLEEELELGARGIWVVEWGGYWKDPPAQRYEIHLSSVQDAPLLRRMKLQAFGESCSQKLAEWARASGVDWEETGADHLTKGV